jgi:hypothetical protein
MPNAQPQPSFGKYSNFFTSHTTAQATIASGQITPKADLAANIQIFTVDGYFFFFPVPPH